MQWINEPTATLRTCIALAGVVLAGCDGTVTVDVATTAPADTTIDQVLVGIRGVEFRRDDGNLRPLEFSATELVNLTLYSQGATLRAFTNEQLPDGQYTGVRLLFDPKFADQNRVITRAGGQFELKLGDSAFGRVDFEVNKDESNRESVVTTLDLRQSLRFDRNARQYTLVPVLVAALIKDTGQIAGAVRVTCPAGTSLQQGGAVYLFAGENVNPDDRDGTGVEPYLTTAVTIDPITGAFAYALRFIPEGRYTLSLTCRGNEDDPTADNDLRFRDTSNVRVRASTTTTHDIVER